MHYFPVLNHVALVIGHRELRAPINGCYIVDSNRAILAATAAAFAELSRAENSIAIARPLTEAEK